MEHLGLQQFLNMPGNGLGGGGGINVAVWATLEIQGPHLIQGCGPPSLWIIMEMGVPFPHGSAGGVQHYGQVRVHKGGKFGVQGMPLLR